MTITLSTIGNLQDTTTAQTTLNANFDTIEDALNADFYLITGDQLSGTLDANSNQIINLPNPATAQSPLRLQDLVTFNDAGTISNIPATNTAGLVLTSTGTAYNVAWDPVTTAVAGTNISVTGSTVSTVGNPTFTTSVTTPDLILNGSSTGTTTLATNNTGSSNFTITVPAVTGTMPLPNTANTWTSAQTFNGTTTFADASSITTAGLGSLVALGVSEIAPSAGNVNISGQYQVGGAQLATTNLGDTTATTTWTPAITASSTAGTPAYTTQKGYYVKYGKLIVAWFQLVLSGWTGTPSGNVTITGLPVTSNTNVGGYGSCGSYTVTGLASTNYGINCSVAANSSVISLTSNGNTGTTTVTASQTGTTPTLNGYVVYSA